MKMDSAKSFVADRSFVDLDKPSLEGLSFALRHPETWPQQFSWDYGYCNRCAMGLACRLWDKIEIADVSGMAREFAMPYEKAIAVFQDANLDRSEIVIKRVRIARWFGFVDQFENLAVMRQYTRDEITPEMVADDIDAYLASRTNP